MATTKAAQFKALAKGTELTLPSGFTVVARRVDVRTLLKTGRIPNSLRPVLDRAMQGERTSPEALTNDVMENPEKLEDMFKFIDQVFVDAVVDPKTAPNPAEGEEDDPDIVYPRDVHDNDKMFIMNWAMGGSSDLERFRSEQDVDVARVQSVIGDGSTTE